MNLNPIRKNMTEVEFVRDGKEYTVLFSYRTPVACFVDEGDHVMHYRTSKKCSSTTSRHVKGWLMGSGAIEKPQAFFDDLIEGIV